jgi:23S rRNA pseudouridine1911/1915/1917 synthase
MTLIKQTDLDPSSDEDLFVHRLIIVDKGQTPLRIDKFLMDRLENVSRNRVQNAISSGAIVVNDKEVKSNYKVRPLDQIAVILPGDPNEETELEPQNIPLDVVYEDDSVMIINKPAGLVVHPGSGNWDGTLVNGLLYYFNSKDLPVMEGNTKQRPGLVHRIDKDTSGLMVIAKSEYAMTHLSKQFFDHTIDRTYHALVWGEPKEDSGTIEGNIGRHPRERMQMTVFEEAEEGKEAITHYEVLEKFYYVTYLKCKLETGRTHQIRVHMKHIGCTLFNDERYGGNRILKGTVFTKYRQFVENCFDLLPRQALHAQSLGFEHPITKERMFFELAPPDEFMQLLDKWRNYKETRKETLYADELSDEEVVNPNDLK